MCHFPFIRYCYAGKAVAFEKSFVSNAFKGTAGKVKADVFGTVGFKHVSKTSGSVGTTAKVAYVQLDTVGGVFGIGRLSGQIRRQIFKCGILVIGVDTSGK